MMPKRLAGFHQLRKVVPMPVPTVVPKLLYKASHKYKIAIFVCDNDNALGVDIFTASLNPARIYKVNCISVSLNSDG